MIEKAREFALKMHGDQDHGCLKIGAHLEDVATHVAKHYDDKVNLAPKDDIVAAAWLHDVLEDTEAQFEQIEDSFGLFTANIVWLVTDQVGKNRVDRHLKTYHYIRADLDATLVKLCDRRHNQERSIKHGEHWMAMYKSEYLYFKFALWQPNQFVALWDELDSQFEEMNRRLTW